MNTQMYSIGIIGGYGIMGSFFHSVFCNNEIESFVWGRESEESLQEFCRGKDIIMVSVPIDKTEEVITSIAAFLEPSQCICDVTSVKVPAMESMKKSGCLYFGMHPMFAPPISGKMGGQNIIFCEGNAPKQQQFLESLFTKESAIVLHSSAHEHDEIMSIVQGLSHFLDVAFIQTLHKKNIDLAKIFASRSPAYALKMMLAGRTLAQDANLYGNIQIQNPLNIETLKCFFEESQKLFSAIESKNLDAYCALFEDQTTFLGEYAKKSQDESDIVIDFLAEKVLQKKEKGEMFHAPKHPVRLGILGPKHTFSHLAAQQFFGEDVELRLYPSISGVFSGFLRGEISEIFVPIENILHGSVPESIDGISKIGLPITALYEMKIVPSLFCMEGTEAKEITEIFSHPQALAQCSEFLEDSYPHVRATPVASTAAAIVQMRETPFSAAIAPQTQGNSQGVKTIHSKIANQHNNATRFAYLSNTPFDRESEIAQGGMVFSFHKDAPGTLETVLHLFSQRGINLTKIESRPTGKAFGEYIFFVTYEAPIPQEVRDLFFDEIREVTSEFTFLGEFCLFE